MKSDSLGEMRSIFTFLILSCLCYLSIYAQDNEYLHRENGNKALKDGDMELAIAHLTTDVQKYPTHKESFSNRALAYKKLGRYYEAINDCKKSIELDPSQPEPYIIMGGCKLLIGDNTGAIMDCTRAIELNPKSADAYSTRGLAKKNLDNFEGAVDDYNKAIQLEPKSAVLYLNRGVAYIGMMLYDEGIKDCSKAIELDSKNFEAYAARGVAYRNLEKFVEAVADYNKAIALKPDYGRAYYNRGIAYLYLEDDRSCADFKTALKLGYHSAGTMIRKHCQNP